MAAGVCQGCRANVFRCGGVKDVLARRYNDGLDSSLNSHLQLDRSLQADIRPHARYCSGGVEGRGQRDATVNNGALSLLVKADVLNIIQHMR